MERKYRILVLVHGSLVPPKGRYSRRYLDTQPWRTEYDVITTLRKLGHELRVVGVLDELAPIETAVREFRPHLAFNLLEEFAEQSSFDQHVVAYLELLGLPYTGCNPKGLTLCRNKELAKQILIYHGIPTPDFFVVPRKGRLKLPKQLSFPCIVKSATEEASFGISQASIVRNERSLKARVRFVHQKVETDALVEEYVDGREFYVGVLGERKPVVFPVWEIDFGSQVHAPICTPKVKFDPAYRKKNNIQSRYARKLNEFQRKLIQSYALRSYEALGLTGYARVDLRLGSDGVCHVLEVNPNPDVCYWEDFAQSAIKWGLDFPTLLTRILELGLRDSSGKRVAA